MVAAAKTLYISFSINYRQNSISKKSVRGEKQDGNEIKQRFSHKGWSK
jgi:hypothetical protein